MADVSDVFQIDENFPTPNALLVPGPNQSSYRVFIYRNSDWFLGNQDTSFALAQSDVNSDGTWKGAFNEFTQTYSPITLSKAEFDGSSTAPYTVVAINPTSKIVLGLKVVAPAVGPPATEVDSLNGLTGDLSLTSIGATVTITPSGSTINLESSGGGGGGAFSAITSGHNTIAAMVVDSGASLLAGTGIIEATELKTPSSPVDVSGNAPAHAGQLLISQPGNVTAVWADPLVQGIQAEGTTATTVSPVLVSGKDGSGNLKDLVLDASGNLLVVEASAADIEADMDTLVACITSSVLAVSLPSATVTTLTPPTAAAIAAAFASPLPVSGAVTVTSGTVSATQGTSPWLDQINGVQAVVNAGNSSTTPLGSGATFTGTPVVDLTAAPGYTAVQVQVLASQNGTVQIQFSTDNSNWDHVITGIVTAADSTSISTGIHGRYMRVVYINGATTQVGGYFRLQTLLVPTPVSGTIKDLDTPMDGDDNALMTHTLITGHTTAGGGAFVDVKVNPSGAITAAVTAAAGDVIVVGSKTHNAAVPTTDNIGALVAVASAAAPSYGAGDQVLLSTDLSGQLRVNASFTGTLSSSVSFSTPTTGALLHADINFSMVGDHTIITHTASQTIRIMRMILVVGGTVQNSIAFKDSTPATLMPALPMLPYQGLTLDLDAEPYYITGAGKDFIITSLAAAQVSGTVWYTTS